MALKELYQESADHDIKTASHAVLTHTPTVAAMCIALIKLGDGAKNLSATGGAFQLVITVGGQTVQPSPQSITFSTAVRAAVWTTPFAVPANDEVIISILSPNAADADVHVTASLFDMTYAQPAAIAGAADGLVVLSEIAEMAQGAPPATPTIVEAINYLYRRFRNKNTTTTTVHSVFNDAESQVLFKETHSDDGTTFTKGEYVSGA
jgi:hypothetical protein